MKLFEINSSDDMDNDRNKSCLFEEINLYCAEVARFTVHEQYNLEVFLFNYYFRHSPWQTSVCLHQIIKLWFER